MSINNNGFNYGKKGKAYTPEFNKEKKAKWNTETKKEWIMYVVLKSDMSYSLSFPAQFFKDESGFHWIKHMSWNLQQKTDNNIDFYLLEFIHTSTTFLCTDWREKFIDYQHKNDRSSAC